MDVLRNKWSMAKLTATKSDQNGLVQSVYLETGDRPETENQKELWKDLSIKLYSCSKIMCSIPN